MNDIDTTHPTEAFLRGIDVHSLLPQQEPFVMVGTLVRFDDVFTATETLVRPENIFVDEGRLTASGLIENIAQTCAARIGYTNKYILKKGIQIGFIGAVRSLVVNGTPQVGSLITTTVQVKEQVFGMTLAHATVTCNGTLLAETEMKIAIENNDKKR